MLARPPYIKGIAGPPPRGAKDAIVDTRAISIIDDDESIRVAAMMLLRLHGFVVNTFASAEDFLRSPSVHETCCLIVDVQMPGMNGLALQERLRDDGNGTPIIFITAFPEERNRTRAMAGGAACFLSKPFDGQTLISCVDKALNSRNAQNL
jgi:FixJ family two-component response regulator